MAPNEKNLNADVPDNPKNLTFVNKIHLKPDNPNNPQNLEFVYEIYLIPIIQRKRS